MVEKIFCVDDDPITLMLCKKVIERASFANEIDTAQNGEEAIEYFEWLKDNPNTPYPTLTLLDLNMPVMNGWEFLDIYSKRNYHEHFKNAKFIVLSSTIDPHDIEKISGYSMIIDFLSKPITKEMIENLKLKFDI
jgi:CheY-like chemotaxis protein